MFTSAERKTRLSAGILAGLGVVLWLCSSLVLAQSASSSSPSVDPSNANEQAPALDIASPENIAESRTPAAVITKNFAPVAAAPKPNPGANLMSVMFGLLVIVALIFALAWLVRKMGQGGLTNNSTIKIVAAMPLGTRERLVVIDVAGQQLLLGITATQINTLHVFPEPVIDRPDNSSQSEFGKKLLAILQQKPVPTHSATQTVAPVDSNIPNK